MAGLHHRQIGANLILMGRLQVRGIVGCGGVIRGDFGEWPKGFSIQIDYCNSKMAEAWAMLEGL